MGISVIKRINFEGSDEDYKDYLDTIKEVEMETEKYDYDLAKTKTKTKNTKVASLRSSKDKKFMGHTGRA
jgi:hypothetical protein